MKKTSVYLDDLVLSQLKLVAVVEGTKVNELLIRGARQVLAGLPSLEALEGEVEAFRTAAAEAVVERDRLANEVRNMQELVERAMQDGLYRKGAPFNEAKAFWDRVMEDAARVLRENPPAMRATDVFPHIKPSLKLAATLGSNRLTAGRLRGKMLIRAGYGKFFTYREEGDLFVALDLATVEPAKEGDLSSRDIAPGSDLAEDVSVELAAA